MNISQDFSLTASVWDGDKFLIEAATANGSRQMKVTAEVVRAYLNGTAGPFSATDRRVLPFRGFMDSGEISPASAATALPLEVWFVRSAARFAVAERSSSPVSSSAPPKLYDNWEGRSLYNDGLSPAAGNLYVCQSDDRPYWWTGAELRPIVTDTTGTVIADAIPLDEIDAITAAACSAACYVITGVAQAFLGASASLVTSLILLAVAIAVELAVLSVIRVRTGKAAKEA